MTDNDTDDKNVSLYDGHIAWEGYDGNDTEIYYAILTASIPEPASILLMGIGLFGIVGVSRKFKNKAKEHHCP